MRGRLLRELDGFESTCYRICEAIFAGGDCFCEFDLLDSITLSDTEALLMQTVTPERAALSVVAPESIVGRTIAGADAHIGPAEMHLFNGNLR